MHLLHLQTHKCIEVLVDGSTAETLHTALHTTVSSSKAEFIEPAPPDFIKTETFP
jgi:hypothetical protein